MTTGRHDNSTTTQGASLLQRSNLTTSQLYIWMGQQLQRDLPLYNMALSFAIAETLDVDRFRNAFKELVAGCDALRTVFRTEGGVPFQYVRDHLHDSLQVLDFSRDREPERAAGAWCHERAKISLDLEDQLFDTALLKVADDRFIWYLNQHHLITDAWSTAVLYARQAELYRGFGEAGQAPATKYPKYADYIAFEREFRETAPAIAARDHWRKKGEASSGPLRFYGLPGPRGAARTTRVDCPLGTDRTEKLRALAQSPHFRAISNDLSLYNLVCTILFAWLHRVCDSDSLAILTPSHNRRKSIFREMAGLFIEIFLLHVTVDSEESFASLATKVRQETFSLLQFALPGTSSHEANRETTVLLNFINRSFGAFGGAPMSSEWIHPEHGDAAHSLRVQVHDFDESSEMRVHFDFHCEVFPEPEQRWAIAHFLRIVDACLDDVHRNLGRIQLSSEEDLSRLRTFNPPPASPPPDESVVQLFQRRAAEYPTDIAAVCGNRSITYGELDARSTRIARVLVRNYHVEDTVIAILMPRSIDLLVALLGVLKAGAAYVPLDPRHPPARLAQILTTGKIEIAVTTNQLRENLSDGPWKVHQLDRLEEESAQADIDVPLPEPNVGDLAYIIYTSGSTGAPKGVMVSHGALANYVTWAAAQYTPGTRRSFALFTSPAFDLTVTSIYVPLITGGKILVYEDGEQVGDLAVLDVMEEGRAEVLKLTPSHLALLLKVDTGTTAVKCIILGGENLKATLAQAALDRFGPDLELYNEYGPTEATVGCMIYRYRPGAPTTGSVSLGVPAANSRIYLLDDHLAPVPPGIAGELYIAGAGLAQGYYRAPDLTATAFLPDSHLPGTRMYRTGDRARWRSDGELEFLGRADEQVKVRGARVELAEIEGAIAACVGIRECVVTLAETEGAAVGGDEVIHCRSCGLASNVPGATIDETGVCNVCREYDGYRMEAERYFRTMDDLRDLFDAARADRKTAYDCMMLLSGGKDSTFALGKLKEMGLRVLVFSLDNGYISEDAKANIRKVVEAFGMDLVFGTTPAMNAVFVDSLHRYSNVCNGCFKVIYTLAMECARQHGIRHIVTGLSRGQIFDTRLKDFYRHGVFDPDEIDRQVVQARKAYHRAADAVSQHMDVAFLEDDAFLESMVFVDFYRYCDVELAEMYRFIGENLPWVRPADTGRSTNCLINEVGIFVHKRDRGHHNYASPYSWDVRLGHKTRNAALEELDDDIDETRVQKILREIGYAQSPADQPAEMRLAAYYVASEDVSPPRLRAHLNQLLPPYMVPQVLRRLEQLPLTANGKLDRRALREPGDRPEVNVPYAPPESAVERTLAAIWQSVMGIERVGRNDNFIELGGDSILNIQIVARASDAGLTLTPRQLFDNPTVAELSAVCEKADATRKAVTPVTGELPITPVQHWFFDNSGDHVNEWNHEIQFAVPSDTDQDVLRAALHAVMAHHDALALRFKPGRGGWLQEAGGPVEPAPLPLVDLNVSDDSDWEAGLESVARELHTALDIRSGPILRGVLVRRSARHDMRMILVAHHLVIDAASWGIVMRNFDTAFAQLIRNEPVKLPAERASIREWSELLASVARRESTPAHVKFWTDQARRASAAVPSDLMGDHSDNIQDARTLCVELAQADTDCLLGRANLAYGTRPAEFLYAALGNALCEWMGTDTVLIDTESQGRTGFTSDDDWSQTVGWFTALYPVLLIGNTSPGSADTLTAAKDRLRSMPGNGSQFGVIRYLSPDESVRERLRGLPRPDVLFNYLGRFDRLLASDGRFQPVGPLRLHRHGDIRRPHRLAINAMLLHGRLHVEWEFNPHFHHPETIENLAQSFLNHLHALLNHCTSRKDITRTASDFPMAKLNASQFQNLSAALGSSKKTPDDNADG